MAPYIPFPLYQNTLARHLREYGVTVHSLRRTYAYLLKSSGVHVTTAARLMGHANPMVTLSIYTQVRDDEILNSGLALHTLINSLRENPMAYSTAP
jgi:integrase